VLKFRKLKFAALCGRIVRIDLRPSLDSFAHCISFAPVSCEACRHFFVAAVKQSRTRPISQDI